jgi:SPP1 family predicted phage head-tail adaptor
MQSGKLRHLVTLEQRTTAPNEFGEPVESWSTYRTVRASREDIAGREWFAAQQTQSEVTTRFELRYMDGVTTAMRVMAAGVPYNIVSVADPEGRRRKLVLLTTRST